MSDIDKLAERIAERLTEGWEAGGVVETAQVIAAELRKEYQTPPDSGHPDGPTGGTAHLYYGGPPRVLDAETLRPPFSGAG